jgi:hypothetical protein
MLASKKTVTAYFAQIVHIFFAVIKIDLFEKPLKTLLVSSEKLFSLPIGSAMISILMISSIKFTPPYFQLP